MYHFGTKNWNQGHYLVFSYPRSTNLTWYDNATVNTIIGIWVFAYYNTNIVSWQLDPIYIRQIGSKAYVCSTTF